jgi:hypothetical protein
MALRLNKQGRSELRAYFDRLAGGPVGWPSDQPTAPEELDTRSLLEHMKRELIASDPDWRPVPRSEPVAEPHKQDTDMFINGYVD